jgi:phosphatidylinositol alpha-1,6-mannosyltransferase
MRILMFDNEFPPLGGGMGVVNQVILKNFAGRSGLEIDLITASLGGRNEVEQFSDHIRIFKVPVWNKNIHHSSNRELVLYAIQAFWKGFELQRKQHYDFCFAWSAVPAGAVAWLLLNLCHLPYLVVVSGPDIPGFEQRYRNLYKLITPLIRAIWKHASPLIVQSREEATLVHTVVKDQPVEIIPNGVDLTKYKPGTPIPDDGPLQVFCAARLIERKGQHHLIRAVKRLEDEGVDVVVRLAGTGDALEELQTLTRELGVDDHVSFLGVVPRDEMPGLYAAAHVFVLPSFNEGMSMAALEAMGAGLPLLLTHTGGTEELVEEGVNGFTHDWGDVETLVIQIRQLAQDRGLARRMGEASRLRAARFSWEGIAERYMGLFTKLYARETR